MGTPGRYGGYCFLCCRSSRKTTATLRAEAFLTMMRAAKCGKQGSSGYTGPLNPFARSGKMVGTRSHRRDYLLFVTRAVHAVHKETLICSHRSGRGAQPGVIETRQHNPAMPFRFSLPRRRNPSYAHRVHLIGVFQKNGDAGNFSGIRFFARFGAWL